MDAANALCNAMQQYRLGNPDATPPAGIGPEDQHTLHDLFATTTSTDAGERHQAWIAAIQQGRFSCGPAGIAYDPTGPSSWKAEALGTSADAAAYHYDPGFLTTRWKYFHDALQLHRLTILHDIPPAYGICSG